MTTRGVLVALSSMSVLLSAQPLAARTAELQGGLSHNRKLEVIAAEVPNTPIGRSMIYEIILCYSRRSVLAIPSSHSPSDLLDREFCWRYVTYALVHWNQDDSLVAIDEGSSHGFGTVFVASVIEGRRHAQLVDLHRETLIANTKQDWLKVRLAVDDEHPSSVWHARRRLALWIVGQVRVGGPKSITGEARSYEAIVSVGKEGDSKLESLRDTTLHSN